jgi:hypothetical protein
MYKFNFGNPVKHKISIKGIVIISVIVLVITAIILVVVFKGGSSVGGTWNCDNGKCDKVTSGTPAGSYSSIDTCRTGCTTWNCTNNTCVNAPSGTIGTYVSEDSCNLKCGVDLCSFSGKTDANPNVNALHSTCALSTNQNEIACNAVPWVYSYEGQYCKAGHVTPGHEESCKRRCNWAGPRCTPSCANGEQCKTNTDCLSKYCASYGVCSTLNADGTEPCATDDNLSPETTYGWDYNSNAQACPTLKPGGTQIFNAKSPTVSEGTYCNYTTLKGPKQSAGIKLKVTQQPDEGQTLSSSDCPSNIHIKCGRESSMQQRPTLACSLGKYSIGY